MNKIINKSMSKTIKSIALLGMIAVSASSQASLITNGDFASSCSLSGWGQDTAAGDGSDFSVGGMSPNCTADVSVSDTSWSNTLFQDLELGSVAMDSGFLLSVDFTVASNDSFVDDLLSVGLFNTDTFDFVEIMGGYAMDLAGTGNIHLDFALDNSFFGENWALEFNLIDTVDDSLFGDDTFVSTLSIRNVSLFEVPVSVSNVPEPTSLAIFALGFAGLFSRRKLANELIRKSIYKSSNQFSLNN